jgi:hypothetical protein
VNARASILCLVMLLAQALQPAAYGCPSASCETRVKRACCQSADCGCCAVKDKPDTKSQPIAPANGRVAAPEVAYVLTTSSTVPAPAQHDVSVSRMPETRPLMHRMDGVSLRVLHCSFLL